MAWSQFLTLSKINFEKFQMSSPCKSWGLCLQRISIPVKWPNIIYTCCQELLWQKMGYRDCEGRGDIKWAKMLQIFEVWMNERSLPFSSPDLWRNMSINLALSKFCISFSNFLKGYKTNIMQGIEGLQVHYKFVWNNFLMQIYSKNSQKEFFISFWCTIKTKTLFVRRECWN